MNYFKIVESGEKNRFLENLEYTINSLVNNGAKDISYEFSTAFDSEYNSIWYSVLIHYII